MNILQEWFYLIFFFFFYNIKMFPKKKQLKITKRAYISQLFSTTSDFV